MSQHADRGDHDDQLDEREAATALAGAASRGSRRSPDLSRGCGTHDAPFGSRSTHSLRLGAAVRRRALALRHRLTAVLPLSRSRLLCSDSLFCPTAVPASTLPPLQIPRIAGLFGLSNTGLERFRGVAGGNLSRFLDLK